MKPLKTPKTPQPHKLPLMRLR
jgi:hypothetical protein